MHELLIAMEIVRIAEKETAKANIRAVKRIELEIGTLAGLEIDTLEFVWHSVLKDSALDNASKETN
ncbi:MAG: hydrogenase maturation nickel metallochaperone HypA [Bacteroidota bacterium]